LGKQLAPRAKKKVRIAPATERGKESALGEKGGGSLKSTTAGTEGDLLFPEKKGRGPVYRLRGERGGSLGEKGDVGSVDEAHAKKG